MIAYLLLAAGLAGAYALYSAMYGDWHMSIGGSGGHQLYRVWAFIDPAHVTSFRQTSPTDGQKMLLADVEQRLAHAGFTQTLLVTQDPTDARIVTALSRWSKKRIPNALELGPLRVFKLEAVEEPPVLTTAHYEPPPASLDDGLTPGEVSALKQALATDDDVKHLTGFAATLEPYFPVAASLLRAKATLLSAKPTVAGEKVLEQQKNIGSRLVSASDAVGWFGEESKAWTETASIPENVLLSRTRDLGPVVSKSWAKQASKAVTRWLPTSRVMAIEDALGTARALQTATTSVGGIPLEDTGEHAFVEHVKKAHPLFSLVPKPGAGVLAMFIAAPALAVAQPLPESIRALAAALPERYRRAYILGVEAGRLSVIAKGPETLAKFHQRQDFTAPEDLVSFDLGLCLGRAQALQEAGFRDMYHATRGKDLAARAADFSTALTHGIAKGTSVQNAIAEERARDVRRQASQGADLETVEKIVKQLAVEVVKDGSLMRHHALEDKFKVPSDIASAARSVVEEIGPGVRIVSSERLKRLIPPRGLPQFVSPAALQLAMAAGLKRQGSNVTEPDRVGQRVTQIKAMARGKGAHAAQAKRAHEELVRAKKTLERQRWVEWYRKNREG